MKTRTVVMFVALLVCSALGLQPASAQTTYLRDFGIGAFGLTSISEVAQDGTYAVAGSTFSADILVIKLDAAGRPVWQRSLSGPDLNATQGPVLVTSLADDGYIVARSFFTSATVQGMLVARLDGHGGIVWVREYRGIAQMTRIVNAPGGDIVLVGYTRTTQGASRDALVVRIDGNGAVRWQRSYGGGGDDVANSAAIAPNDGLFVAGTTTSFGSGKADAWVLRLDSDGLVVWQRAFGGPEDDQASDIVATPGDGGAIIVGTLNTNVPNGSAGWAARVDASGTIAWQRALGVRSTKAVARGAGGNYGVTGAANATAFLVLDPAGNLLSQHQYNTGASFDEVVSGTPGTGLSAVADGGFVFAGQSLTGIEFVIPAEGWVLKLDQTGGLTAPCSREVPSGLPSSISAATTTATTVVPASTGLVPMPADLTAEDVTVEARATCPFTPEGFITDLYTHALDRSPSARELAAWVDLLSSSPTVETARSIVHAILGGVEYLSRPLITGPLSTHVGILYRALLAREASTEHVAWGDYELAGFDTALPVFVNSPEFQHQLPNFHDRAAVEAFVTRFYVVTLGRTPGPSELDGWADYLGTTGDVLGMAKGFFDSFEYTRQSRTLSQHVDNLYQAFLTRDPTANEASGWVNYLHSVLVSVEDSFVSSPEFQARFRTAFP